MSETYWHEAENVPPPTTARDVLIERVKAYAAAHYNNAGHGWGTGQGTGKYATIRLSGETWNHLHMPAGA
jgi:hypothetical protein